MKKTDFARDQAEECGLARDGCLVFCWLCQLHLAHFDALIWPPWLVVGSQGSGHPLACEMAVTGFFC